MEDYEDELLENWQTMRDCDEEGGEDEVDDCAALV